MATGRRPGARYYLDTSAYLCILLGERGAETLAGEIAGAEIVSSSLLALEASRNLVRLARGQRLTPAEFEASIERLEQDLEVFALRDLTLDLCLGRVMPLVSTPRSLDLAHLRTAHWFHSQSPLTRFVSLDPPQIQCARELGLPV